jgi:transcriptional regulator with PAS, ATPase and Fis domain
MLEELSAQLTYAEAVELYQRADTHLAGTERADILRRLRAAARALFARESGRAPGPAPQPFVWAAAVTERLLTEAREVAGEGGRGVQPVLVTGETGVGKEVLSHLIHHWSGRPGRFVALNCAALTDALVESLLFGHVKGSFTDAVRDYQGAVREAAGGTLLLDEIGELSLRGQSRLLRLVELGEIQTVGSDAPERVDVRIIAATNRDLREMIARGQFRQDLYYRLQTFHLDIPPLRERPEDIQALARHFIESARERLRKVVTFAPESLEYMGHLSLKGNARELRAIVERAVLLTEDGGSVTPETICSLTPDGAMTQINVEGADAPTNWEGFSLEAEVHKYEERIIRQALRDAGRHVTRAARLLGVKHQSLAHMLKTRHRELLSERKAAATRRRRKSIIRSVKAKSAHE